MSNIRANFLPFCFYSTYADNVANRLFAELQQFCFERIVFSGVRRPRAGALED